MKTPSRKKSSRTLTAEQRRLAEAHQRTRNWKRWGPYLSERQWSTVREDYSPDGTSWESFPHDHARSRAYRWGEDGLLGFCDRECRLGFSVALWNGRDPILKERLFGLTGPEGNHGEDVKELYYYLDSTPSHSWMEALYKYPHAEYPYRRLIDENARRGLDAPEFEILDTGVFNENRYCDIRLTTAKVGPDHLLIRLTVSNRGPDATTLHLLPQLCFRNNWSWGGDREDSPEKPCLTQAATGRIDGHHATLGDIEFHYAPGDDGSVAEPLFTDNETNQSRLWGVPNKARYVKDAFHRHLINGEHDAINPDRTGTKAALHYTLDLGPGESRRVDLQLVLPHTEKAIAFGQTFDRALDQAKAEADEFYATVIDQNIAEESAAVIRQAYAGLLWSKQFYYYVIDRWLKGDPTQPTPPQERLLGRNHEWSHVHMRDILSMPDKWEYPWFAAWDLAFHMIPLAHVDPDFAKDQLTLLLREWYLHPNGQIPAYEFQFSDVNPPVHAWAAWRVYKIADAKGHRDRPFLESVFQKLLLNFTWWVNRKDAGGNNIFSGGFLGLDNIGVFDRNKPIPGGGDLRQADGTAWMAFYAHTMLGIALELAWHEGQVHPAYEDMASKFFNHFVQIVEAMNHVGGTGLWDEADGFYYDQIDHGDYATPLKTRSLVGLLPLIAVEVIDRKHIERLPGFKKRYDWFLRHHSGLSRHVSPCGNNCPADQRHVLLAVPPRDRLVRVLRYLFDETEFLSPHGLRSVSKYHQDHPFIFRGDGRELRLDYTPGESNSHLFGGNSNWRGPIWFPINYLLIEALERYHAYYGDELKVELPTGSHHWVTLREAAQEIERRLGGLFLPDKNGHRPCHGDDDRYATDPHFKDLLLFHEYFHGDNGRGLGASHQTGWTALVIRCLNEAS